MPAAGTVGYDRMVGVGFGVLAVGGFWLSGDHLASVVDGVQTLAPIIGIMRLMAAAPFAAMILALVAAMLLLQPSLTVQRRIWWGIAACVPGVAVGPIAAGMAADSVLPNWGYMKCDRDLAGGRHSTRWARTGAACLLPG